MVTTMNADSNSIRLTHFSHAAGCGCKIAPAVLEQIIGKHTAINSFPSLLVGNQSNDDAAVWDIGNGLSMLATVDFFMPIVDDAYDFGRIAAANALSDIYAMGGKPVFANALLGWPVNQLPLELASRVLEGARAVCEEAHIPIAGGHSIDTKEPMFGLAVNGLIETRCIKKNNTAQAGDLLFMTKPLGLGIIATATKRGIAQDIHVQAAVDAMCTLNVLGPAIASIPGVHAMTDITGFGFVGHLFEMIQGSNLSAEITVQSIPRLEGVSEYIAKQCYPDSTFRNWNAYEKYVHGLTDMSSFVLLNDPQTSGGLLISVSPDSLSSLQIAFHKLGLDSFFKPIGKVTEKRTFVLNMLA